jgi:2-polyprenyl-3-methyl-5-hydroxy-6-metoxy-1,4-benzoquinol methylase
MPQQAISAGQSPGGNAPKDGAMEIGEGVMQKLDPDKLNAFLGRMVGDLGAVATGALVLLGDHLGLFKAMKEGDRVTAAELAKRTGTNERYVREWLAGQAAAGYVEYDAGADAFYLNAEQAVVFADEDSPAFMAGAFEVMSALWLDEPKVLEAFRTGKGRAWHEHSACLFRGTERFFRPGYNANLVSSWLPALDGVVDKLQRGAHVADVGCGHGASTVVMARAFPQSHFTGYDYHPPSIERARKAAEDAGVSNISFDVAQAKTYPGTFDLVTFFDCLHDMGDPMGASAHVLKTLRQDGTWMIVEPLAHDHLEDNLNPVGRVYYAASTMICTPASLAQEVGAGLGAQAGEVKLRQVVSGGGFTRFRRVAETPFNMVLEARP